MRASSALRMPRFQAPRTFHVSRASSSRSCPRFPALFGFPSQETDKTPRGFLMARHRTCPQAIRTWCHVSSAQVVASLGFFWSSASEFLAGPLTLTRLRGVVGRNYFSPLESPQNISLPGFPALRCSAAAGEGTAAGASGQATGTPSREDTWLIVGLGNPGVKYQHTRHNVGFELLDALAEAEGIAVTSVQCKAAVGKGRIAGTPVVLAKPQTFMNVSGESVGPLAKYYKVPLSRILVMYDDLDLDFAVLKLLGKGGHGGHNGMRSIIDRFGGDRNFPRLRFGIGRPPGKMEASVFVLRKFTKDEREQVDFAIARGVEGVRLVLQQGLDRTVSQWSQRKEQLGRC